MWGRGERGSSGQSDLFFRQEVVPAFSCSRPRPAIWPDRCVLLAFRSRSAGLPLPSAQQKLPGPPFGVGESSPLFCAAGATSQNSPSLELPRHPPGKAGTPRARGREFLLSHPLADKSVLIFDLKWQCGLKVLPRFYYHPRISKDR